MESKPGETNRKEDGMKSQSKWQGEEGREEGGNRVKWANRNEWAGHGQLLTVWHANGVRSKHSEQCTKGWQYVAMSTRSFNCEKTTARKTMGSRGQVGEVEAFFRHSV